VVDKNNDKDMSHAELIDEWKHIVSFGLIDIMSFKELEDIPEIADHFFRLTSNIFNMLSKLKHNRFYNSKELETVFTLVKPDIYTINDLLIELNDRGLPALIYEVIFNVFEELVLFVEDFELFEWAQNLMKFRTLWFSYFGVKIIKLSSEQR
jgi:hypothetical protein